MMPAMIARVTIPVDVPEEAIALSRESADQVRDHLRTLWILDLIRKGRISTGKAAELLALPVASMMELMAANGLPHPNYSVADLRREVAHAMT